MRARPAEPGHRRLLLGGPRDGRPQDRRPRHPPRREVARKEVPLSGRWTRPERQPRRSVPAGTSLMTSERSGNQDGVSFSTPSPWDSTYSSPSVSSPNATIAGASMPKSISDAVEPGPTGVPGPCRRSSPSRGRRRRGRGSRRRGTRSRR